MVRVAVVAAWGPVGALMAEAEDAPLQPAAVRGECPTASVASARTATPGSQSRLRLRMLLKFCLMEGRQSRP